MCLRRAALESPCNAPLSSSGGRVGQESFQPGERRKDGWSQCAFVSSPNRGSFLLCKLASGPFPVVSVERGSCPPQTSSPGARFTIPEAPGGSCSVLLTAGCNYCPSWCLSFMEADAALSLVLVSWVSSFTLYLNSTTSPLVYVCCF